MPGKGLTKNYSSAEEWLRKAAKQGDADAQKELLLLDTVGAENDNAVVSAFRALQ